MNTLALIFTCFAGLFSFGFLIAGFAALLSQDLPEIDDFQRRRAELHRKPGPMSAIQRYFWVRREVLPLSRIVSHWQNRPTVRLYLLLGMAFFAAAFISGQFASLPR